MFKSYNEYYNSHVKPILVLYFSVELFSALAKYDVRIYRCMLTREVLLGTRLALQIYTIIRTCWISVLSLFKIVFGVKALLDP